MNSSKKSNYPEPKSNSRKQAANKSKSPFKNRVELSDWIETSLMDLETKYASFKTVNSTRTVNILR